MNLEFYSFQKNSTYDAKPGKTKPEIYLHAKGVAHGPNGTLMKMTLKNFGIDEKASKDFEGILSQLDDDDILLANIVFNRHLDGFDEYFKMKKFISELEIHQQKDAFLQLIRLYNKEIQTNDNADFYKKLTLESLNQLTEKYKNRNYQPDTVTSGQQGGFYVLFESDSLEVSNDAKLNMDYSRDQAQNHHKAVEQKKLEIEKLFNSK